MLANQPRIHSSHFVNRMHMGVLVLAFFFRKRRKPSNHLIEWWPRHIFAHIFVATWSKQTVEKYMYFKVCMHLLAWHDNSIMGINVINVGEFCRYFLLKITYLHVRKCKVCILLQWGHFYWNNTHGVRNLSIKTSQKSSLTTFPPSKMRLVYMSSLLFLLSQDVTRSLLKTVQIFMFLPNYLFIKCFFFFHLNQLIWIFSWLFNFILSLSSKSSLYYPKHTPLR